MGPAMKQAIVLALLLACDTVQAAEWVSIGTGNVGKSEDFIDVSSITIAGSVRKAWFKTVLAPHYKQEPGASRWWAYFLSLEAFNCQEKTNRREVLVVYYDDGDNYRSPATTFPKPWAPVVPDTITSGDMRFICAWKPK